jgi:hypothetical protein
MLRIARHLPVIGPLAVIASAGALFLGGRGAAPDQTRSETVDPAVAAALDAPLLTDPDLATQNARFAAIAVDPFAPGPAVRPR